MLESLNHVLPVTAGVSARGRLAIGGCDTQELAREFGTPLFVFCEETFRRRSAEFKTAAPDSKISYASKAFLCLAMCRLVQEEGLGLDVASGGELEVALRAGFPPELITLHGNNKQDREIARAVEAGVDTIVIDSLDEVERVQRTAAGAGTVQRVLVRVTPGVHADTHEYIQTGQEDTKFGVALSSGAAAETLVRIAHSSLLELGGLHCHIGSNIFSFDAFARTVEILFAFIEEQRPLIGMEIEELNLGGGFGIPYVASDRPVEVKELADLVRTTAEREARARGLPLTALSFEPGRLLVGNAMITLYEAGTIKELPGIRTYLSVDGGMSDNIRPPLYRAAYSAISAASPRAPHDRLFTIAGMHCESGDVLIRDALLPSATSRGDLVGVCATGAYGYSMSSNYNKQPRPGVVLVSGGHARLIVRRETLEDLLQLDA